MSPDDLTYTGSKGDEVSFDIDSVMRIGDGDSLRSRAWQRTLGSRSLVDVSRCAREVDVEVAADKDEADRLRRVLEYDMAKNSPGTLSMGGWSQRALVPESSCDEWRPGIVVLTLKVALLDGVWRRPHTVELMPLDKPLEMGDGKGFPHGYPYAYSAVTTPTSVYCPGYLPAQFVMTVYGPASRPEVVIGGNAYRYEGDVPSGGHLTIDSVTKTAEVVNVYGAVENAMPSLVLGYGEGSGEYAFQPIEPGYSSLVYDGSFGVTLTMYEEEGEPPWTS